MSRELYGPAFSSIRRIIAVTSCKGGVGKSSVSFELARRLSARGNRVGLMDADVHGPSLPTQLPPDVSARGVVQAADGWSMAPLQHESLALMSFGWLGVWSSDEEVDTRGAGDAGALAVQLLHTTAWGDLDFLIIDTPPGTAQIPRAMAARGHLSGAIVVTTPSKLATADVVRGVSMLSRFDVPVVAVVENMSSFSTNCDGCGQAHTHFPFGTGHLDAVMEAIGRHTNQKVPTFQLPIVASGSLTDPSTSALSEGVDALAESLEQQSAAAQGVHPVELPQLAWHERPSWKDKLFFASRGADRRLGLDRQFQITPPKF